MCHHGHNGTTGRTQLLVQPTRYSGERQADSLADALPDSEEFRSVGADAGRPSANVTVPTRTMARRREILRSSKHHNT